MTSLLIRDGTILPCDTDMGQKIQRGFVATRDDRIELIVKRGAGFIYYVSREGVTGMQTKVANTIARMTSKIRSHTNLPIAVGFGISTPEQARTVAASAEAVVVGSAIVNQIAQHGQALDIIPRVSEFVQSLVQAVKTA